MRLRLFLATLIATVSAAAAPAASTLDTAALPEFNRLVLDVIAEYPTDGTHDYWWPRGGESGYDGCSRDMFLAGERVMEGEPEQRTFCCGLTLEVFLEAYNRWLEAHGGADAATLSPGDWPEFQRLWFVVDVNGPGPSAALERFNLGHTIASGEAVAGDFVQLWRHSGSGHSVVFLDWVRNESTGEILGIRYWSTQPGTQGIRENVEMFGNADTGGIADEHTHWGRVELPTPAQ